MYYILPLVCYFRYSVDCGSFLVGVTGNHLTTQSVQLVQLNFVPIQVDLEKEFRLVVHEGKKR